MVKEIYINQLRTGESLVLYQSPSKIKKTSRGIYLLVIGLVGLLMTFSPIILAQVEYFRYSINSSAQSEVLNPQNLTVSQSVSFDHFQLTIPKINLNLPVIPEVNPYDENEYNESLKKGLAHAKGTSLPGQGNTVYIFGHSSGFLWDQNPYSTAFLMLDKLNLKDKIIINYANQVYIYQMIEKKVMESRDFSLLTAGPKEKLVLQTCWPPASNWKRLAIIAELIDN